MHEDEIADVSWAQPDTPTRVAGAPYRCAGPTKCARAYKRLLAAQIEGETFWELFGHLSRHFFSLFSPYFSPKKYKNTSKLLDSSLFSKNTRYCSYPPSSSPWFYTLDLRYRGMDVAFWLQSIPLFL